MPRQAMTRSDSAREIEFYEAYGRALAEWARIEYVLALIFAELSKIDDQDTGVRIFYSVRTFKGRIDMLNAALSGSDEDEEMVACIKGAIKKSHEYSETRNRLAHDSAMFLRHEKLPGGQHIVINPEKLHDARSSEHIENALTISSLREIRSNFERLRGLLVVVHACFFSDTLPENYREQFMQLASSPYTRKGTK
jgi:hypothetical protein